MSQQSFHYTPGSGNSVRQSSDIPCILHEGEPVTRAMFWQSVIRKTLSKIAQTRGATYIATGGGYGSNNTIIDHLKKIGAIQADIPSIQGEPYRDHPSFESEKRDVLMQIAQAHPDLSDKDRNNLLRAFYSDEVNTKIAKGVVNEMLSSGRSVIHESASIYPDTIERANLAKTSGMRTRLIACDFDHTKGIAQTPANAFNTINSFAQFAKRFESELVPLFDEIQLYDTDATPPKLIAEKKEPGESLEIYDQNRYAKFICKKHLDPERYRNPATVLDVIAADNTEIFGLQRDQGKSGP